jgi:hypothetical protein
VVCLPSGSRVLFTLHHDDDDEGFRSREFQLVIPRVNSTYQDSFFADQSNFYR